MAKKWTPRVGDRVWALACNNQHEPAEGVVEEASRLRGTHRRLKVIFRPSGGGLVARRPYFALLKEEEVYRTEAEACEAKAEILEAKAAEILATASLWDRRAEMLRNIAEDET